MEAIFVFSCPWGLCTRRVRHVSGGGGARRPSGFTLLEVLVVIAVGVVLAGIVMTQLPGMRERTDRVVSLSNFRQSYTLVQMFAGDNQGGIIPSDSVVYADKHGRSKPMSWCEILGAEDYVSNTKESIFSGIFYIAELQRYWESHGKDFEGRKFSLARNSHIGMNERNRGTFERFTELMSPERTLLLTEGTLQPNGRWFWLRITRQANFPKPTDWASNKYLRGKRYACFADGHVEMLPAAEFESGSDGASLFWTGR